MLSFLQQDKHTQPYHTLPGIMDVSNGGISGTVADVRIPCYYIRESVGVK